MSGVTPFWFILHPLLGIGNYNFQISIIGAHRSKGTTEVQQSLKVKTVHMHSGFSMKHLKNDIALHQLDRPACNLVIKCQQFVYQPNHVHQD